MVSKLPTSEGALTAHSNSNSSGVPVCAVKVMILKEDDLWCAQGLEINHAAVGRSLEEARDNFTGGLAKTISQHENMYGDIGMLLKVAPNLAWQPLLQDPMAFDFTQISIDEITEQKPQLSPLVKINFPSIAYLQHVAASETVENVGSGEQGSIALDTVLEVLYSQDVAVDVVGDDVKTVHREKLYTYQNLAQYAQVPRRMVHHFSMTHDIRIEFFYHPSMIKFGSLYWIK